jgi:hypothetical protein
MTATLTTPVLSTTITVEDIFAGLDRCEAKSKDAKAKARNTVSDALAVELVRAYTALDLLGSVSARSLALRGKKEKRKGLGSASSWRTRARAGRLLSLPLNEDKDILDAVAVLGKVREHGELFNKDATEEIIFKAENQSEAYEEICANITDFKAGLDPVEQALLALKAAAEKVAGLVEKGKPVSKESKAVLAEALAVMATLS